jgi:hypothetical protein
MSEEKEKGDAKKEAAEVKEILTVVSTQVPALIKSLLASVFSEEAGKNMGKAAAAYYKELKEGGMPEDVAVKMTQEYMKTFTSLGSMMQNIGKSGGLSEKAEKDLGEEIERRIHEKLAKRHEHRERESEEDEEEE